MNAFLILNSECHASFGNTDFFFFANQKFLKNTNNNSYYSKNKQKEMYTGAPEKCLEVFAFTKKRCCQIPRPKQFKYTPGKKSRKKHKKKKNNKQTHNILIINNYNFTIF